MRSEPQSDLPPVPPSTRPFTQGVGTVHQFVGVILFLISMFACCSTSLLSKDTATHTTLTNIGWHRAGDAPDSPTYSAQRALTIALLASLCYVLALATMGLGLQSENQRAPAASIAISAMALIFWITHVTFFASMRFVVMSILCTGLVIVSILLLLLSVGALRETPREARNTEIQA